jgi:hypothetical protein
MVITGLAVGMIVGFVEGTLLYLIPEDVRHRRVLMATMLKGALLGVSIGLLLRPGRMLIGAVLGAALGFVLSRVSFIREGGMAKEERSYAVPISVVSGLVIGILTVAL